MPIPKRSESPRSTSNASAMDGHAAVADLVRDREAIVCFEPTGSREWQLWASLDAECVAARQAPLAQFKAFAQSRGTGAKTARIDAELIARFSHSGPTQAVASAESYAFSDL